MYDVLRYSIKNGCQWMAFSDGAFGSSSNDDRGTCCRSSSHEADTVYTTGANGKRLRCAKIHSLENYWVRITYTRRGRALISCTTVCIPARARGCAA